MVIGGAITIKDEYKGRISWDKKGNVSPVEVVFSLSNISQSDARKYALNVIEVIIHERLGSVELTVTGKKTTVTRDVTPKH